MGWAELDGLFLVFPEFVKYNFSDQTSINETGVVHEDTQIGISRNP